jgi:hypothetical protein
LFIRNTKIFHAHSEATYNSPVSKQSKSFSETFYGHDKTSEFSSTPKYGGAITKQTEQFTDQPSILSTSYLTNGVAVYSRNRRKQQNNPRQYVEQDYFSTLFISIKMYIELSPSFPCLDCTTINSGQSYITTSKLSPLT